MRNGVHSARIQMNQWRVSKSIKQTIAVGTTVPGIRRRITIIVAHSLDTVNLSDRSMYGFRSCTHPHVQKSKSDGRLVGALHIRSIFKFKKGSHVFTVKQNSAGTEGVRTNPIDCKAQRDKPCATPRYHWTRCSCRHRSPLRYKS